VTEPTVQLLGADQQPVTTIRPDQPIEIRVTLAPGTTDLPDEVEVTITTDRDTTTISVPRQPGAGGGNPTYTTGTIQLGHGVAEGYGIGKGGTARLDIGNGGTVFVGTEDGGGATVTWYPDELQEAIGEQEAVLLGLKNYLTNVRVALAGAEETPEVRAAREIAQQKAELITYVQGLLANDEIWPRSKVYLLRVALRWLMQPGMVDLREVYPEITNAINQGKEEGREVLLSGFADLTMVLYEQLAGATGAGAMWTLVFGQDIYGKDVTAGGRLDAAAELALTALITALPILHMRSMTVGRTTPRIARPTPEIPRPIGGVSPRGAPAGVRATAQEFGMLPDAAAHVNTVASRNGAIIQVRPTNQSAMRWRDAGHPGKPMDVKAKTINETDVHLGAREEDIGLVGYFQPKQPTRTAGMSDRQWAEIQTRYNDRVQEFKDNANKMDHLQQEGKIRVDEHGVVIDTGICGGTGKGITGDYDLWRVTKLDGTPFSAVDEELIVNQLRFGAYGAQHGAHTSWKIDPNAPMYVADPDLLQGHLKVDADIRAKHQLGADRAEAVLEFGGVTRPPVTAYEGGGTPGAVTAPSAAAVPSPPIAGARRITTPTRIAAGAAVLVFVIGAGWVALRQDTEVTVTPNEVVAATTSTSSATASTAPVTSAPVAAANRPPQVSQVAARLVVPTTTYTAAATDPEGGPVTYTWQMERVAGAGPENDCGTPKVPWRLTAQTVSWSHPGRDFGPSVERPCPHDTTDHPVMLTLTVTDAQGEATVCVIDGSETRTYDVAEACQEQ
jgi:hypothetical protein